MESDEIVLEQYTVRGENVEGDVILRSYIVASRYEAILAFLNDESNKGYVPFGYITVENNTTEEA